MQSGNSAPSRRTRLSTSLGLALAAQALTFGVAEAASLANVGMAISASGATVAQTYAPPQHTLATIGMAGAYHTPGSLTLYVYPHANGDYQVQGVIDLSRIAGRLRRQQDGSIRGILTFTLTRARRTEVADREVILKPAGAELSLEIVEPARMPDPGRPPELQIRSQPRILQRLVQAGYDTLYADYVGDWVSAEGSYTFGIEGPHLRGREIGRIEGVPEVRRELAFFRPFSTSDNPGPIQGAWGDPRAGGDGDSATLELSPDKSELYLRWRSGTTEHRTLLRRARSGDRPRSQDSEGGPDSAGSPPVQPRPAPPATPPAVEPGAEAGGFQRLAAWSVRVDRIENPRDDRLTHVYLTLRNDSSGRLLQTQGVSVLLENAEGLTLESGQGLKAQPGYPELFGSPPPVVLPGREIRTKFVFDRQGSPRSVTVLEGDASATFEF